MLDAYILDGVRTPFGRHAGALAAIRPDDLLAQCLSALLARHNFDAGQLEDVVIGCTNQAGEDARNVARHAALLAGIPSCVAAQTHNRLCGSGLSATIEAARALHCGEGELLIAGGVESMSRAPFVMAKNARPYGRDVQMFDSTIGARFPNPAVEQRFGADTMPQTADNIAADLAISREDSDAFAWRSQQRYEQARQAGFFEGEIIRVEVPGSRRGQTATVTADEHPRPQTSLDKLAELHSLFAGGAVTAGNASGINDGAATLLLGNRASAERLGIAPMARIVSCAVAGVDPRVMGLGPVPAITRALDRARLTLADMDVIEINEAFATQVLGCLKQLGLGADDGRVNPNGGAIAVGHPLGASGARLALTAIRQLHAIGGKYAVVSLCIGLGQGVAMVLERCER